MEAVPAIARSGRMHIPGDTTMDERLGHLVRDQGEEIWVFASRVGRRTACRVARLRTPSLDEGPNPRRARNACPYP